VRQATAEDVAYIAAHLRSADRDEIEAAVGEEPEKILNYGLALSDFCGCFVDPEEVPVGLFGASSSAEGGLVWMVSTPTIERYPLRFLRRCRAFVDLLQHTYGVLHNYVDARNAIHIRWLRWLGFTLEGPFPYGVRGLPFYKLIRKK